MYKIYMNTRKRTERGLCASQKKKKKIKLHEELSSESSESSLEYSIDIEERLKDIDLNAYDRLIEAKSIIEKNEPNNTSLKEKLVGEVFEVEKYWDRGFNMGIIDLIQNYHQLTGLPCCLLIDRHSTHPTNTQH